MAMVTIFLVTGFSMAPFALPPGPGEVEENHSVAVGECRLTVTQSGGHEPSLPLNATESESIDEAAELPRSRRPESSASLKGKMNAKVIIDQIE